MRVSRLAVLLSGGGTDFQSVLDAIGRGEIDAQVAVVIADRAAGGLERAKAAGIPTWIIPRGCEDFDAMLLGALKEHGVEGIVLAGFLSILSKEIVEAYPQRIINIHPSLIPSFCGMNYYGAKVHEAVLAYGCKLSGATVHFVDEGADTGPIILQESVEVKDDDTVTTLAARVLELEHALLPRAVKLLCEGRLRVEGRKVIIS